MLTEMTALPLLDRAVSHHVGSVRSGRYRGGIVCLVLSRQTVRRRGARGATSAALTGFGVCFNARASQIGTTTAASPAILPKCEIDS